MSSLRERLIEAIEESGETLAHLAMKSTGIDMKALREFIDGDRDIRLSSAEKLADHLGLELVQRED